MATDAQGRQLSEDGYYYWDGSNWQPVQPDAGATQDTTVQHDTTAQQEPAEATPTADELKAAMNFETNAEISPV